MALLVVLFTVGRKREPRLRKSEPLPTISATRDLKGRSFRIRAWPTAFCFFLPRPRVPVDSNCRRGKPVRAG